jgi:hypothetical protein
MNEGLLIPRGLTIPPQAETERLEQENAELKQQTRWLLEQVEVLRRRAGEAPMIPTRSRRERRAAERQAAKARGCAVVESAS